MVYAGSDGEAPGRGDAGALDMVSDDFGIADHTFERCFL